MALAAAQAATPTSPPVALAPPETVDEFLVEAEAVIAPGSNPVENASRAEAVRTAIQQAAMAYRAALEQAAQRGEPAGSCPPPLGQAQLSLGDMIADFRAFPVVNRAMPLATAFALVMTLRFPCENAP